MTNPQISKLETIKKIGKRILAISFTYFFVLRYIYPKYFRPLIPHHTDMYDYFNDFISYGIKDFLKAPRIAGDFIFSLTNLSLGDYRVTLIFCILLTLFNVLLLIEVAEKYFKIKANTLSVIVYSFCIFIHPSFYISYTYDIYSMLSLTFALLFFLLWNVSNKKSLRNNLLLIIFISLSVSSKETYIVSILAFLAFQFLLQWKKEWKVPLFFIAYTFLFYILNYYRAKYFGSSFSGTLTSPSDPYFISLNPRSLWFVFSYYLDHLANKLVLLVFVIILALNYKNYMKVIMGLFFVVIGIVSYLPYIILPNHVVPHYAWLAVPLCYLVIFIFPWNLSLTPLKFRTNLVQIGLIFLMMLLPFTSYGFKQDYVENEWAISPETVNRNVHLSLDYVIHNSNPGDKILITGLYANAENPYKSLYYLKSLTKFELTITLISLEIEDDSNYVKRINPLNVHLEDYDKVFAYNSNGLLSKLYTRQETDTLVSEGNGELIIFPNLNSMILDYADQMDEWYPNMLLGNEYMRFGLLDKAEVYLLNSLKFNTDNNPYPIYFFGELMLKRGNKIQALEYFNEALKLEPSNIHFINAVNKLKN